MKRHLENIPWLEDGLTNDYGIEVEIINTLPLRARRHWRHVDFDAWYKLNGWGEPEPPESPDNPLSNTLRESEKPVDVVELSEERKTKLKAIALGEITDQKKESDLFDKLKGFGR